MSLFPAPRSSLDQYDEALAAISNGPGKAGGVAVGGRAADAMLAARENDGVDASQTWIVGTQPGQWRPTPPSIGRHQRPDRLHADVRHPRPRSVPLPRPNALTSAEYATDFNEVKSIGAASSTTRTSDQTQAAIFWAGLRNPWWSIFDQIALARHLRVSETARMLALVYISKHDSFRRYARFSDALTEIKNARVWGAIHSRTADDQGAVEGAKLVAYVWFTRLQPTR